MAMRAFGAEFGKGMRRSTSQQKKGLFSEKGGGNSVNGGLGKDFYRKCNSVKSGRFSEPPDFENRKVTVLIPFPKESALTITPTNFCLFPCLFSRKGPEELLKIQGFWAPVPVIPEGN